MQRAYLKIYIFYDMHMHLSFKSVLVNERPTDDNSREWTTDDG